MRPIIDATSLRSLGAYVYHSTPHKRNTHLNEQSDVESQWDRPLVEEREEFFALSREEEKAV